MTSVSYTINAHYKDVIMGVSNPQPHDCLLNRLFGCRSKKVSKPCVTGLCVGKSPGTDEFPAQMASNAESVSIWWRHHVWIWQICDLFIITNIFLVHFYPNQVLGDSSSEIMISAVLLHMKKNIFYLIPQGSASTHQYFVIVKFVCTLDLYATKYITGWSYLYT